MKHFILLFSLFVFTAGAQAETVGTPGKDNLIVAQNGKTRAVIIVSPDAGKVNTSTYAKTPVERTWEKQAALDLQKYIALMSGATPQIVNTPETIAAALKDGQRKAVSKTDGFYPAWL